jgi:hypothetical protein
VAHVVVVGYALWGVFGSLAAEGLEFMVLVRKHPGQWPWKITGHPGLGPYTVSVTIRMFLGGVLAAAVASSGEASNALAAFGIGVVAPLVLEKIAAQVPLQYSPADGARDGG